MISARTTVVAVIGNPVAHSLSPRLHNAAFAHLGLDWVSLGFRVDRGCTADALSGARALGIRGLSVTMPHKDSAASLVDQRTEIAERVGAVNCVTNNGGTLVGDNTDGRGLVAALRRGGHFEPEGRRCLVVGAGGAARSIIAALAESGASEVVVVNRTLSRGQSAAALAGPVGRVGGPGDVGQCDLVVNATSTGMAGVDASMGPVPPPSSGTAGSVVWPLDPSLLVRGQVAVDLVYYPAFTPWLEVARSRGVEVLNGLGMLVHQAALQIAVWTAFDPPVEAMWRSVRNAGAE
ncbi:MAG: shikimate dehydrogenase [Acidimicrobiales bacterium]